MGRLRLHHRIVVPFLIIVLVATAGAALVALSVASRALQTRVQAQLASAAAVVSRGDLALNRAILNNVRGITGADIITFGAGTEVLASTVDETRAEILEAARRAVASGAASARSSGSGTDPGFETPVVTEDCGSPCLVAYRPVEGRAGVVVALVAETSELGAATRAVARAIVLAAALSAGVMVLVGQLVVRRVTAPLQRLVQFARDLSPDDFGRRAPVSDDEIGALADAFNGMLDRLQQSREALVRSEKLAVAGLLAARVAHDIRNPLASMKIQAQLLQARARQDGHDQATIAAVLRDIEQVESVVHNLVEVARPGDLARQRTAVNVVVRDALQQLSAQFAHRKIAVQTRFGQALPEVSLDFARFRQALLNLLVNASEAMTAGGEIIVETRLENGEVLVEICDDGTGIDPAIADKVFDPFFSTKREGVGLGLMNVKAVVEGHGGRIRLHARAPRGTCALVALPVEHG